MTTSIRLGETMSDGTFYAGISQDTGKAIYMTEAGIASLARDFNNPGSLPADRTDSSADAAPLNNGYAWGFNFIDPVQFSTMFAP